MLTMGLFISLSTSLIHGLHDEGQQVCFLRKIKLLLDLMGISALQEGDFISNTAGCSSFAFRDKKGEKSTLLYIVLSKLYARLQAMNEGRYKRNMSLALSMVGSSR